jgi:2-dehydro-3-deoxygluconokinase
MKPYDVVTLGETMLRLTPPGYQRIEQTKQFDVEVGGTESNTAVGLARLGLKVAWLSRLPDTPPGRIVAQTIASYGVDTSHIVWTDDDRVGIYFWEHSHPPRPNLVIYDRQQSAISRMTPEELPSELFQAGNGRHLHLTGITLAISHSAAATAKRAAELARAAGWTISFDLNFRSKLWSAAAAQTGCEWFMQTADLLITPLRDAQLIYQIAPDTTATNALQTLAERYPGKTIVMTLGAEGAIGLDKTGQIHHQPAIPTTVVDRLGSGDAFAAGLLYGCYFADKVDNQLAHALRWGTAMAAIKRTIPGDLALVDKTAVQQLVTATHNQTDVR